jgi:hypothetical protein
MWPRHTYRPSESSTTSTAGGLPQDTLLDSPSRGPPTKLTVTPTAHRRVVAGIPDWWTPEMNQTSEPQDGTQRLVAYLSRRSTSARSTRTSRPRWNRVRSPSAIICTASP